MDTIIQTRQIVDGGIVAGAKRVNIFRVGSCKLFSQRYREFLLMFIFLAASACDSPSPSRSFRKPFSEILTPQVHLQA